MKKFDELQAANFLIREVIEAFPEARKTLDNFGLIKMTEELGTIDEEQSQAFKEALDTYSMFPRVPTDEYARAREVVLTLNDAVILLAVWGRLEMIIEGEEKLPYETYIKPLASLVKELATRIDNHYVGKQVSLDRSLKSSVGFSYVSAQENFWDWSGRTENNDLKKAYEALTNSVLNSYLGLNSIFLESRD